MPRSSLKKDLKLKKRGFTLFFAILVSTLLLSIAIAILNMVIKEHELSVIGKESQFAFFAADAGVECAVFWDNPFTGLPQGFATSTISNTGTQVIRCAGRNINVAPAIVTATRAVTIFTVDLSFNRCAIVTVDKENKPPTDDDFSETVITSRGRNNCAGTNKNIVERGIIVRY